MDRFLKRLDAWVRSAERDDILLYVTAFLGIFLPGIVYLLYRYIHQAYTNYAEKKEKRLIAERREQCAITIFHTSDDDDRSELIANIIYERFPSESPPIVNLASIGVSEFSGYMGIGIFIICCGERGLEPENAEWFFDWLDELAIERSSKKFKNLPCRKMHFAILGIDNSKHGASRFNRASLLLSRRLRSIGAKELYFGYIDLNSKKSLEEQVDGWVDQALIYLEEFFDGGTLDQGDSSECEDSSSAESVDLKGGVHCRTPKGGDSYLNLEMNLESTDSSSTGSLQRTSSSNLSNDY